MPLLTPDDLDRLAGSIDCPISWCTGLRAEHGADGESPDTWLHSGEHETLNDFASGLYTACGPRPRKYYLALKGELECDAAELAELAEQLRALASALDARRAAL